MDLTDAFICKDRNVISTCIQIDRNIRILFPFSSHALTQHLSWVGTDKQASQSDTKPVLSLLCPSDRLPSFYHFTLKLNPFLYAASICLDKNTATDLVHCFLGFHVSLCFQLAATCQILYKMLIYPDTYLRETFIQ